MHRERLSSDDVAIVTGQIAALTAAGLPLDSGLRATADELPWGRVRRSLRSLAHAIEAGESVEEAVHARQSSMPGHLRGLIVAGTRSGRTSEVLGRFLAFATLGKDLRQELWARLAYPSFCLLVTFGVFVFVCAGVVGPFSTLFRDFGMSLPAVTEVLIAVSRVFQAGWPFMLDGAIGVFLFVVIARVSLSAPFRRSLLAGVPVFGGVWRNASLCEFCHLLALLLECDMPLIEAMRLTGEGVQDTTIGRACDAMAVDLEGGLSLSAAISRRAAFPVGLARILRWAEGYQGLPESLHTAGEIFEARARTQAVFSGMVLAVVSVIALLMCAMMVFLGLFLPTYNLLSKLSG